MTLENLTKDDYSCFWIRLYSSRQSQNDHLRN